MSSNRASGGFGRVACGVAQSLAAAVLLSLAGCQALTPRGPNDIDPFAIESRDDIVQVVAYWPQSSWTYDADGNPKGIRPAVYFVSGQTQKGAFVSGPITISLAQVTETGTGGEHSTLRPVHEWRFDSATHRSFRVSKKAITGYYYGFPLDFPPNVNIAGKEIEVVVAYQRGDGRTIESTPKRDKALALRWPKTSPVRSATSRPPRSPPVGGGASSDPQLADARATAAAPPISSDAAPVDSAPPPPRPRRSLLAPPASGGGPSPTVHRFRPVQAGSR